MMDMLHEFIGKELCSEGNLVGTVSAIGLEQHYNRLSMRVLAEIGYNMPSIDINGKTVTIDGCYVGKAIATGISYRTYGYELEADIAMTDEAVDCVREYQYIMRVMG